MARTTDQAKVDQKRREISAVATEMFAAQGFEHTSVSAIARAVGISSGSVFYYFRDKAAIFRAAFENDLVVAEEMVQRHAAGDDPLAACLDIIAELGADARQPGAAGMVAELVRRVEHDPELVAVVEQTAGVLRNGIAELIARAIEAGSVDPELDPQRAAAWLQAIVDGAYLNAEAGKSLESELRRSALGYLTVRPDPSAMTVTGAEGGGAQ